MGIVGCGIMLAGLVAGAMFGGIIECFLVIIAGSAIAGLAAWQEHQARQEDVSWRKAYPPYGY